LRFFLWELRCGQTLTVVGSVSVSQNGLLIAPVQGPLLGDVLYANIISQSNKTRTWMLVLGIPDAFFLMCGLIGALTTFVRMLVRP
jgi:hypothetical protein